MALFGEAQIGLEDVEAANGLNFRGIPCGVQLCKAIFTFRFQ